jgi:hypothetical protein
VLSSLDLPGIDPSNSRISHSSMALKEIGSTAQGCEVAKANSKRGGHGPLGIWVPSMNVSAGPPGLPPQVLSCFDSAS